MVPCSRSRMIAAPARMMPSMVMLLMSAITLVNHAPVMFGLNAIRTSRLTGDSGTPSEWEITDFLSHSEGVPLSPVNLDVRIAFNPNITGAWFTSVMALINNITMLGIILAGAAIIREREHGTMDHLLVMPLTPFEIAMSKVWANGLVVTVAVGLSLYIVVRTMLGVPIAGSLPLFMVGVVIYLFFATAIGIFLGTVARSMPQLGLLFMLIYVPMIMLSAGNPPLETMPAALA